MEKAASPPFPEKGVSLMTNKFAVAMLIWISAASWALADEPVGGPGDAPLVVCADAYSFPASMKDLDPPGYDIEIIRAIAKRAGFRVEYVWADTGTRGGLGRALRSSIAQKKCNLFIGLGISSETVDEIKEKHLIFTHPYMSEGYVLIEKGNAAGKAKLSDFRDEKIGVAMSTPADAYLFDNGYKRSIFVRDRLILKALNTGEIDVALVWSPALAYARKDFSSVPFQVSNQMPEVGLRWNVSIAVPEGDIALKELLDKAINELVHDGEIKRIVESYGVPFYPPMS
jgi:ABC-type amino acid transport substrate-binding protein